MDFALLSFGLYLLAINAGALFLMAQDKLGARHENVKLRYSEGLLFFLAILGGSVGVYAGMIIFRHKTQKIYFFVGIPLLAIQQLLLLYEYSFLFQ